MPTIIPVKFAFATHDLWFDPVESGAVEGDHVICTTERGTEIGLATGDPRQIDSEELKKATSGSALRPVDRVATDEDLELADELARRGDDALPVFRRLVEDSNLDMKPVGVEYLFGGEKVVCYFAAEERVDFRQLVRDLSRELHERIDMRQIGVREEAGLVGGFGHCGQELCCARFGGGFDPVSIRMAKEQDLPLNSSKISGACGRLMCCLRYEFEAYRDFKSRAPKKNAVIDTPLGKAKIIEYDTPKEQLALRLENGKQVRVPLSGMTCSEAAHKKSEDLGCPCRPDTVTRDVLESLQSPDVDMALADLDRANGIIPKESFDESDIFVEKKRPRRRKSSGSSDSASESNSPDTAQQQDRARRGDSTDDAPAPQEGTRRRRRAKTVDAADASQDRQGEKRTSRRRHHHSEEGAGASAAADGTRRPDAPSQGQSKPQGQQPKPQGQQPKPQGQGARRTRRPGDRGGSTSGEQASRPVPDKTPQEGEAGDAPKRKRRHRGGRGRGKGTGPASGEASGSDAGSSQE